MSVRELMGRYPVAAGAVAAVLVLLAVVRLATMGRAGAAAQPGDRWHLDLTTGELFPGSAGAPDLQSPAGNPGALAMVYGCGGCDNVESTQIAYIERYTEQGMAILAEMEQTRPTPPLIEKLEVERLVSPPVEPGQSPRWIAATSPQGRLLLDIRDRCGSGKTEICMP
jgi:hypothetical protein